MVETLDRLRREGVLTSTAQPTEGTSYARRIDAAEAVVHWAAPAAAIERKLRAFDPEPGAYGWLGAERIKLWRAQVVDDPISRVPGIVVATGAQGIDVACGEGVLRIIELQPPGGRRMSAAAFLAGRKLAPGARFLSTAAQG